MTFEIKTDAMVEKMTNNEIKAEWNAASARLELIEPFDPTLTREQQLAVMHEIDALENYKAMLKGTMLCRR